MKKTVITLTAAAVVIMGAASSEARCGVGVGFRFIPPPFFFGWSEVRYVAPPPPERVVVYKEDDGCKKVVKKIYDEDGYLIDWKVYRDCRERDRERDDD